MDESLAPPPDSEPSRTRLAGRLRFAIFNLASWSFVAAVSAGWIAGDRRFHGVDASWASLFLEGLTGWWLWAAVTVVVFRLTRRHSPRRSWTRLLVAHAVTSVAWMPVYGAALVLAVALAYGVPPTAWSELAPRVLLDARFFLDYFLYWPIVAVSVVDELRRVELERQRLSTALAEGRLAALRAQIQPHFLFNCLAAVSGLVRDGRRQEAVTALHWLADLLRAFVTQDAAALVTLDGEIELARKYLELQRLRFGPRLSFEIDVSPDAAPARIASLVLQPLVENAVEHGAARMPTAATISIAARRTAERLSLSVENPLPDGARFSDGLGVGLANVRDRLRLLYGERQRLDLRLDHASGRARAEIEVPWSGEGAEAW